MRHADQARPLIPAFRAFGLVAPCTTGCRSPDAPLHTSPM